MVEIYFINNGNKTFSVKIKIIKNDNDLSLRILNVDEIDKIGHTSFTKLKNIFTYKDIPFNTVKYNGIFNNLINQLQKKFKVNKINLF